MIAVKTHYRKPPPVLLQARVLEYAILPKSTPFLVNTSFLVGDSGGPLKPLGRVPRLAICQDPAGEIQLLFCKGNWASAFHASCKSLAQAKARAESSYPGSSRHWRAANVIEASAAKYLERIWGRHRCHFCLKTPLQHNESVFQQGRGRICGACVRELAERLGEAQG